MKIRSNSTVRIKTADLKFDTFLYRSTFGMRLPHKSRRFWTFFPGDFFPHLSLEEFKRNTHETRYRIISQIATTGNRTITVKVCFLSFFFLGPPKGHRPTYRLDVTNREKNPSEASSIWMAGFSFYSQINLVINWRLFTFTDLCSTRNFTNSRNLSQWTCSAEIDPKKTRNGWN